MAGLLQNFRITLMVSLAISLLFIVGYGVHAPGGFDRIFFQAVCATSRLASVVVALRFVMDVFNAVATETRLSYWGRPVLLTKEVITFCSSVLKSVVSPVPVTAARCMGANSIKTAT